MKGCVTLIEIVPSRQVNKIKNKNNVLKVELENGQERQKQEERQRSRKDRGENPEKAEA